MLLCQVAAVSTARREQLPQTVCSGQSGTNCSLLRLVRPKDYKAKQLGKEKI